MNIQFCIISNDCWGAEYYRENKLEYNTPFVGLFVPPECFVKICNNIHFYLNSELNFIETSKYSKYSKLKEKHNYPIALLHDAEIHFLHYNSIAEAKNKWSRRLKRIKFDDVTFYIKGCDRDVDDWNFFVKEWNKIEYNKVFFSAVKRKNIDCTVVILETKGNFVIDGLALYEISKKYFNINSWMVENLNIFQIINTYFKKLKIL